MKKLLFGLLLSLFLVSPVSAQIYTGLKQTTQLPSTISPIPINTPTTIISQSWVMPSFGCPCKLLVFYSVSAYNLQPGISQFSHTEVWFDDNQPINNIFGGTATAIGSIGFTGLSGSALSTNTYSNGQTITLNTNVQSFGTSIAVIGGFNVTPPYHSVNTYVTSQIVLGVGD